MDDAKSLAYPSDNPAKKISTATKKRLEAVKLKNTTPNKDLSVKQEAKPVKKVKSIFKSKPNANFFKKEASDDVK